MHVIIGIGYIEGGGEDVIYDARELSVALDP